MMQTRYFCYGLDGKLNRTSSVPKSVLRYELDSTLNLKLPLTNLVPQIKRLMVDES